MTKLQDLLNTFRTAAVSEREKGTYFEGNYSAPHLAA